MTIDAYKYYRQERKTPGQSRDTADTPTDGFWRAQAAKTKPDYPVAIWHDGDDELIQIGNRKIAGNMPEGNDFRDGTWQHCIAVSKEEYDAALDTGFWPDNKAARKMTQEEKMGIDIGSGGNNAPAEETLAEQITALAEAINKTAEPKTQDEANALSGRLDKMRALLRLAEGERVKEKQPHLDAGRDVDAKWQAIGQPGGDAYRDGEARRKAFLRKAQAALDRETAAAALSGGAVEEEPKRATAGSAFGRSSGLRKVKVGIITDRAKFIAALDVGATDFDAWLKDKAQKLARAGVAIDGMEVREELQ